MKVLHVINIGGFGGAEKLMLQLLPALSKNVHIECLILHNQKNPVAATSIANLLASAGIPIHLIIYRKVYEKQLFKAISSLIVAGEFDLLHTHLKYADAWLAWLRFRKKISTPVVSTMHGYNDEYENRYGFKISSRLRFEPYYLVSKWIYRQLNGFILISKIVDNFFSKSGLIKNKLSTVIYHGYDLNLIYPPKIKSSSSVNIAVPGRLLKRKGQQYVIEAMKILPDSLESLTINLYGDGPFRKELEQLSNAFESRHKIIIHGYVDDLLNRLREADLVIVSSLWEGFGLVVLDGFAAGTPVIGFDLPATNEIIIQGENGMLVKPYDVNDLAEKINLLLTTPELRNRITNQAEKDLRTRFSIGRMADDYCSFYQKVISNALTK